jgi:hypothetical protein
VNQRKSAGYMLQTGFKQASNGLQMALATPVVLVGGHPGDPVLAPSISVRMAQIGVKTAFNRGWAGPVCPGEALPVERRVRL